MEVRQTEEGFQESVPALVSISYFPAQVKRPAGTSHVASPGCGQESWIWRSKRGFPFTTNISQWEVLVAKQDKTKAAMRKIVTHTHTKPHTQFSGGERTWACVWHRKYFSFTWGHGVMRMALGEPYDDGVLWNVKPPAFLICSSYSKLYRVYMIMVSFRPKTENLIKLLKVTQLEKREGLRPKQTDSRALASQPNNDEARTKETSSHQHP